MKSNRPCLVRCTVQWQTTGKDMSLKILPELRQCPLPGNGKAKGYTHRNAGLFVFLNVGNSPYRDGRQSLTQSRRLGSSMGVVCGGACAWYVRCSVFHCNTEYSEDSRRKEVAAFTE